MQRKIAPMDFESLKPHHLLIPSLALFATAAMLFFINHGATWYLELQKPSLFMPLWILAVLWQVALAGMIFAAIHVIGRMWLGVIPFITLSLFVVLGWFTVHWSYGVFYEHHLGNALLEALLIACLSMLLMLFVSRISTLATLLVIPYAVCAFYLVYVSYFLWRLNEASGLFRFL